MVTTKQLKKQNQMNAMVPYRPNSLMVMISRDVINPDPTVPCWAEQMTSTLNLLGQVQRISQHISIIELTVSFGLTCFISGGIWLIAAPVALRLMSDTIGLFAFSFVFVLSWYLRTGNPVLVGIYMGCWAVISYKTWWDYYHWILAMQLLTGLASSYEGNYLATTICAFLSPVFLSVLFFFALSSFILFFALVQRTGAPKQ